MGISFHPSELGKEILSREGVINEFKQQHRMERLDFRREFWCSIAVCIPICIRLRELL